MVAHQQAALRALNSPELVVPGIAALLEARARRSVLATKASTGNAIQTLHKARNGNSIRAMNTAREVVFVRFIFLFLSVVVVALVLSNRWQ